ncbi:hypothetical protein PRUPE_4G179300 [Prunus persica]|uniref:Uncharacterized protein n=1 Tax=Prunus persica TaxID=3760 RepID=A0A251PMB1_PRUPE|nr:uncharacterized protein LOC18780970 isoform X2 [Prunus persica]ONI12694.1 hypothetical protein PRUPE_4G179300 [Prunus persica]
MGGPPDLKNWLPRYQYESPALNSESLLDDFGIDEVEREEKEENSVGFRGNGNKDGAFVHEKQISNGVVESGSSSGNEHENQYLSKIPDSSESTSFTSEPTDIRNWFSSYVYESPSLDTTDDFGDSVGKESKHEKDGFLVGNRNREKEKVLGDFSINRSDSEEVVGETVQSDGLANCSISLRDNEQERQPLSETPGPLESPSLLSEPIDIRNWFSSYVYESPLVETNDCFGDFVCKENRSGKDRFLVENRNRGKEEVLEDFSKKRTDGEEVVELQSEGLAKCVSPGRDNKQETKPGHPSRVDENLPSQNDLYLNHMPKSLENHLMGSAQDVEIGSQSTKIKPSNIERSSCCNNEKSPQYMTHNKDFTLQDNSEAKSHAEVDCLLIQGDADLIPVNGASKRKPTHGGVNGKEISEDGFIRTRKDKLPRKSYENIMEGRQEISKVTAPLAGGRDAVVKRKPLADATNFHHSPAMEITGKWKCPQKSKPNLGPSLKQLRLEKWVRKL